MRRFWPCSRNWSGLAMVDYDDITFSVGRIAEVPLVMLNVTPDGVYVEADAMLTVDEATALIEQLKLAIAQVPKLEWNSVTGPFGVTVLSIVEKE